ncbi:hypothetical protein LO771_07920 [Streptacidiphilus sp. ASG 303]|uniref:hypothetical protein n=1 Tax=Streptacidiphilus sp. ASG 303 TaxID=2896847 RepID=UPI001E2E9680|nr:hypothetical protein [Streptacidiphilus sp. ASG 303]MCD0482340.1 hypothetical protein [Streptacidiphilus sp. ASG 303]
MAARDATAPSEKPGRTRGAALDKPMRGSRASGPTGKGGRSARKPVLAQMRLQPGDADRLEEIREVFGLDSTSDVLREAVRRLAIEADEIRAAQNIGDHYGDGPAPLPEGVAPATEEELAAADAEIERGIAEGRW